MSELISEAIQGWYWITNGIELQELWASIQLGDYQHRRNYAVYLRQQLSRVEGSIGGEQFRVKLHIEGVKRKTPSQFNLDFEGVALLTDGLMKVRGRISFCSNGVRGDLHTISKKRCPRCLWERHTDRKRCDDCGEVLQVIQTYSLEYDIRKDYRNP